MSKIYGKYNEKNPYSMADSPRNKDESRDYANTLHSSGSYPAGLNVCFTVGISGGCGTSCWVYQEGSCAEPIEMIGRLDGELEIEEYENLYGKIEH